ncbi:MAG: hypothetical protein PHQ04_00955 [Opitutaceae bacterium]|nr:hypothetical protein [Opitutaceae bacterium]
MSSSLQTLIAWSIVSCAAILLIRFLFKQHRQPGCGSTGCGAVSPEIKKLQANLRDKRDRV